MTVSLLTLLVVIDRFSQTKLQRGTVWSQRESDARRPETAVPHCCGACPGWRRELARLVHAYPGICHVNAVGVETDREGQDSSLRGQLHGCSVRQRKMVATL